MDCDESQFVAIQIKNVQMRVFCKNCRKCVQSLFAGFCGFFCLAFFTFSENKSESFLDHFDELLGNFV